MMKVGCQRRRCDERRKVRLLLGAASAVPMCTHGMCHFLVKRWKKKDARTLGDARFCEMPPSEMGLEREEPTRRRALESGGRAGNNNGQTTKKSAKGRRPRRRRRLVGDDDGKAGTR